MRIRVNRDWAFRQQSPIGLLLGLSAFMLSVGLSGSAKAQEGRVTIEEVSEQAEMLSRATKRIIIPIPLSNPSFGTGGALALVKLYEPEGAGAPWVTGGGVFYTSKGNKAIAGFHKMSLDNDRLRFTGLGLASSLDQAFYGIGPEAGDRNLALVVRQTNFVARVQGLLEIMPDLYVGGQVQFLDIESKPKPDFPTDGRPEIPVSQANNTIVGIAPVIQYDIRDNGFNPNSGLFVQAQFMQSVKALGSSIRYSRMRITASTYHTVAPGSIFAGRFAVCEASKSAPYYDLCNYGQSGDLRGYEGGRYRDRASWAMQGELRQRISGRWGGVVFAGVGGIAPSISHIGDTKFLPAAGAGIRFQMAKDYGVNARLDAAFGRHSSGIYLSLGEAF